MFRGHSKGTVAVGAFLSISTLVALLAATTLLHPGTTLDNIWVGKQAQYDQLLAHNVLFGCLFLGLTLLLAAATIGWIRLRHWGWVLASGIIVLNVLSDAGRAASGSYAEGLFGVCIGGMILYYLFRPFVRQRFSGD